MRRVRGLFFDLRHMRIEFADRVGELGACGIVEFARDAAVGERITTVRRHIDLEDRLVEVQQVHRVVAGLERLVFLGGEAVVTQQAMPR